MSARAVSMVFNHSQATGTDKVVLLGIAWHMTETEQAGAWPSIERLAAYANVSERTVIRSVAKLIESGELDVERHSGRSYGGPRTNRYWIMIQCPESCSGDQWHRPFLDLEPKFEVVDNFATRDIYDISR